MKKTTLIKDIFNAVPSTYKGIRINGEHIIQLRHDDTTTHYATLEKLPLRTLQRIAEDLKIYACEEEFA